MLLPPRRLMDGERVRWVRRLVTTTRLPDVAPLLDTLSRLPLDALSECLRAGSA